MFADECRAAAGAAWDAYESHPWFVALETGGLPVAQIIDFQVADAPFVPCIHRVLAMGLSKAPTGSSWSRAAATLLDEVFVASEMDAKRRVLAGLGVHHVRFDRWALSPAREAYANHLIRAGLEGTPGQIAATLLPCALFADVVGRRFDGVHIEGPPAYKEWATIYADKQVYRMAEAHAELMEAEAGEGPIRRDAMMRWYVRSVQHQVRSSMTPWSDSGIGRPAAWRTSTRSQWSITRAERAAAELDGTGERFVHRGG